MGVKCPSADQMVAKSLDNIVGNLWQQRQESSGSSVGNQSPRNGEDLSDGEAEVEAGSHDEAMGGGIPRESSPEDGLGGGGQVRVKDPRHLIKEDSEEKEQFDPRAILANLPPLPALEAFNKHRDFLANSQNLLAGLGGHGRIPFTSASGILGFQPPHTTFSPIPPARPPSQPTTPSSQQSSSPIQQTPQNFSSQQNWSFEEQFKQLYEIDDNPKRKEFLDELFTMMQKRGTPINRLPIMAKQVLDLFELYNLVVARGGLVEVINKKLWQEVIKGLGLPSSITSAAFTLRTQYTKYLYPFECTKRNLSNPTELQAAIEGNKREGRRGSYGAYPEMALSGLHPGVPPGHPGLPSQISPMSLVTGPRFNGNGTSHPMPPTSRAANGHGDPLSAVEMTRLALLKMYGAAPPATGGLPNLPPLPGLPADILQQAQQQQDKALNLHLQRQMEAANEAAKEVRLRGEEDDDDDNTKEAVEEDEEEEEVLIEKSDGASVQNSLSPPPTQPTTVGSGGVHHNTTGLLHSGLSSKKRHRSNDSIEAEEVSSPKKPTHNNPLGLPGANIKIASRGDGRNGDSSLVVSLEINGTTYQGVLFAQPISSKHRTSANSS